jgi:GNAT superfamily N-acetyltransferase
METGNFPFRMLHDNDAILIKRFTEHDSYWTSVEMKQMSENEYMKKYDEGEWRVWQLEERDVAITYHLEVAPSNQKPWIGTIIVNPNHRRQGIGVGIIQQLKKELQKKGHKAIFAGVPVEAPVWIQFLSDCYFEQFKVEKDEQNQMYIIMVSPLQ